MPAMRKTVVLDDFDGKELPEDTKPINLSMGRTTYSLYLSEKSHQALLKALDPFIKDADTTTPGATRHAASTASGRTKKELADIRAWAKDNGHEVSERGRIKGEVIKAFEAAK
ncbi:histone-like nucleoid-structuring protein Lsr2 [Nocardioides flavescens]|uniref:Lsr2 family protein n=1 Tax=Nocardioides flavescens TaxID=2691959 RepID=A0A6L7EXK5_9ACTN|nr:Lsr2 family protein [Nocardioides flavescens]MXG91560.1 Lsr2 family protein [Nocardioides flavescens]